MSATGSLACTKCGTSLPTSEVPGPGNHECIACGSRLYVEVYPAFFRAATVGRAAEHVVIEGEASCFYHPDKKAVIPCELCGRFLCALCDLELGNRHVCPNCLDAGQKKGKFDELEISRPAYDSTALALAVISVILWFIAPVAFVAGVFAWFRSRSLVRSTRIRSVLAILISMVTMAGWAILFLMLTRWR